MLWEVPHQADDTECPDGNCTLTAEVGGSSPTITCG